MCGYVSACTCAYCAQRIQVALNLVTLAEQPTGAFAASRGQSLSPGPWGLGTWRKPSGVTGPLSTPAPRRDASPRTAPSRGIQEPAAADGLRRGLGFSWARARVGAVRSSSRDSGTAAGAVRIFSSPAPSFPPAWGRPGGRVYSVRPPSLLPRVYCPSLPRWPATKGLCAGLTGTVCALRKGTAGLSHPRQSLCPAAGAQVGKRSPLGRALRQRGTSTPRAFPGPSPHCSGHGRRAARDGPSSTSQSRPVRKSRACAVPPAVGRKYSGSGPHWVPGEWGGSSLHSGQQVGDTGRAGPAPENRFHLGPAHGPAPPFSQLPPAPWSPHPVSQPTSSSTKAPAPCRSLEAHPSSHQPQRLRGEPGIAQPLLAASTAALPLPCPRSAGLLLEPGEREQRDRLMVGSPLPHTAWHCQGLP